VSVVLELVSPVAPSLRRQRQDDRYEDVTSPTSAACDPSRVPDLDRRIDRLDDALRDAGLAPLSPAGDSAALDEIAATLRPWSLPPDLHRFWQRVEAESDAFPVAGWRMGSAAGPAGALAAHRLNRGPASPLLFGPPLLFPIARHSETQWSIELATPWGDGGTIFSHDDGIRVEYPSFGDLVEVYAEMVEAREFVRDAGGGATLQLAGERRRQEERLRRDLPPYGNLRTFLDDPSGWPEHWLAAAGIDLRDREPLGATQTIGELASTGGGGRVAGTVLRLVGSAEGTRVLVDDGTGTIEIWCPAGISPWGPRHGRPFEFDVLVEAASAASGAVATAVRPLRS